MWRTARVRRPAGRRRRLDSSSTGGLAADSSPAPRGAYDARELRRTRGTPGHGAPARCLSRSRPRPLVARLVALAEVAEPLGVDVLAPAGAVAGGHRGVEPQSGDDHERVARIRIDRDP